VGRSEKVLLVLLTLATKHWDLPLATKHWILPLATNNGSFQGPPSDGTFHWPLNWDLPSHPSFSFSLKGRIHIISGSLFFGHNLNLENSCSYNYV
jgi:hypothetical protein